MRTRAVILKTEPTAAFRWLAVFCALSVWMLGLLAVSPQLHASLHSDAWHQDHSCAVTLFSHGADGAITDASVASAPVLFPAGECAVQPALPVASAAYRLPPGRGPPLC